MKYERRRDKPRHLDKSEPKGKEARTEVVSMQKMKFSGRYLSFLKRGTQILKAF